MRLGEREHPIVRSLVSVLLLVSPFVGSYAWGKAKNAATNTDQVQCKDGTFSYSAHHTGACSHHGGVDQWLDGK